MQKLLDAKYHVNVLVRNPEKLQITNQKYLHIFEGNAADSESIDRSIGNCSIIINAVSSRGNWTLIRVPLIVDGDDDSVSVSESRCSGKSVTKKGVAAFLLKEIDEERFLKKSPFVYS